MQTHTSPRAATPRKSVRTLSAEEPTTRIVRRKDVPTIHSVEVDGHVYQLGLLKNFRKNAYLNTFIPEQGRPSIGWVALKRDEVLEVHRHPIPSVIVITQGNGALLDESKTPIEEGDIVCVPPGAPHGFIGRGETGFWALSLQFEERGLYEDLDNPLVNFGDKAHGGQQDIAHYHFEKLQANNRSMLARFAEHPIFKAFRDGSYADLDRKARLVAALQVWSDHFHKMLLLRSATCDHPSTLSVFDEHLKDEFPHSEELNAERSSVAAPWDAELSAACSWFVGQMTTLDNVEKVVLVHMVTECAATVFYAAAKDVLAAEAKRHISAHAEHDCEHAKMGIDLLRGIDETTFERLSKIQAQGWAMLEVIMSRVHALGLAAGR